MWAFLRISADVCRSLGISTGICKPLHMCTDIPVQTSADDLCRSCGHRQLCRSPEIMTTCSSADICRYPQMSVDLYGWISADDLCRCLQIARDIHRHLCRSFLQTPAERHRWLQTCPPTPADVHRHFCGFPEISTAFYTFFLRIVRSLNAII